jgi:hypothetical protein
VDGLELAIALDAGVEQGHRQRRCSRRSSCSGGPVGCHFTVGRGRISEED